MAAALLVAPATGAADALLAPVPGAGEAGASVDGRINRFEGGDYSAFEPRSVSWIKLPLEGRLGARRMASWNLTLRPTWLRAGGADERIVSRQFDHDLGLRLLPGRALSLSGLTTRSTGSTRRGAADLSDFDLRASEAEAALGWAALPVRIGFADRDYTQHWRITPLSPALDQQYRLRQWRVNAENSRLTARLERSDYQDRSGALDYRSWSGGATHTLRWGRGSSLASAFGGTDRTDHSTHRQTSWDERLHLRHLRSLFSEYDYRRFDTRGAGIDSRTESFGLGFEHRPVRAFGWGARGSAGRARNLTTESRSTGVAPRLDFNFEPAAGWRVTGRGDVSFERRRDRGRGDARFLILDERHLVGGDRSVWLDREGADPATLVVRSLDGLLVYSAGTDYVTVSAGPATRLDFPLGSRIRPGDTIRLEYRHAPRSPAGEDAIAAGWQMTAGWRGARLTHRRAGRDLLGAARDPGRAARDFEDRTTEVELQGRTPLGYARGFAQRQDRVTGDFSSRADALESGLELPASRGWNLGFNARWDRRRGTQDRVNVSSGGGHACWRAMAALQLDIAVDAYRVTRPGHRPESVIAEKTEASLRFAAIEARLRFDHQARRATQRASVNQFGLWAVRRF